MRKRIVLWIVAIALFHITALAQVVQGPNVRATNGYAVSLTVYTNLFVPDALTATNVIKIPPILPTSIGAGNFEVLAHIPGNTTFYKSTGLIIEDTTKILIGNGAGLTNLPASAVPNALTNNDSRAIVFKGGLTVTNNLVATNVLTAGATNIGQFRNDGNINWSGVATGDGSGLTNLTGATFPAGPTYVFHGKVTFNSNVVFNSQLIANGQDITNVYEKNVSVTTNGFGVSLIDFSLGTQVDTNMSGNLTLTGISNFNTTNLNWQVVSLNPNGADRVIVVPNEWLVSGFTNATTVTLATTNWGELRVRCQIGRYTNASFEIFYQ